MVKKLPLVCIVIVNWNGGQKILDCLTSLKKTSYKNYKVVLVDNGSMDDSVSTLKRINKNMDIISLPKNFGYTIATNIGWKYSLKKYNADYICAMDSDIVTIQNNWLDIQIKELEKSKEYGISCGKLIFPDGTLQLLFLERGNIWMKDKIDMGQYDFVRETKAVGGAGIIIKKAVIEKIGYYDENFFYGPNDQDYCLRAGKAGFKILYNGLSKSIHNGSSSYLASDSVKIFGPQSKGNILFTFRYHGKIAGAKMIAQQFARIFFTRKYPFEPLALNNLNFHKQIFKRFLILIKSTYEAIRDCKEVKNEDYEKFIIKNE